MPISNNRYKFEIQIKQAFSIFSICVLSLYNLLSPKFDDDGDVKDGDLMYQSIAVGLFFLIALKDAYYAKKYHAILTSEETPNYKVISLNTIETFSSMGMTLSAGYALIDGGNKHLSRCRNDAFILGLLLVSYAVSKIILKYYPEKRFSSVIKHTLEKLPRPFLPILSGIKLGGIPLATMKTVLYILVKLYGSAASNIVYVLYGIMICSLLMKHFFKPATLTNNNILDTLNRSDYNKYHIANAGGAFFIISGLSFLTDTLYSHMNRQGIFFVEMQATAGATALVLGIFILVCSVRSCWNKANPTQASGHDYDELDQTLGLDAAELGNHQIQGMSPSQSDGRRLVSSIFIDERTQSPSEHEYNPVAARDNTPIGVLELKIAQ